MSLLLISGGIALLRLYEQHSVIDVVPDLEAQLLPTPSPPPAQSPSPVPTPLFPVPGTDGASPAVNPSAARSKIDHRARTERVRALVHQSSDLVVLLDADGRRREVGPAAYRTLGWHPRELVGTSLFRDVHPDDLDAVLQFHLTCLQEPGISPTFEFRHRDKDGGWRHLEGVVNNLLGDPVLGSLVLTCRDITMRKAAEASLRASEARWRALVQHASDLIVVVDAEGVVRYASPAIEPLLGYRTDDIVGRSFMSVIHPDEQDRAIDILFARPAATGERPGPIDLRCGHRDGGWQVLEVVATNLLDDPEVGGIVINAHDITEHKEIEERLARQAFSDTLTGLPNRALFLDRLTQAMAAAPRDSENVAVLFLDLDRFKVVNDSLGHAAGDDLLLTVAQRLITCIRPGDTAARFGGDEFAVLLPRVAGAEGATRVAARILEALGLPAMVAGHEITARASIGIVLQTAGHRQPGDMLRDADVALYQAKAGGRGRYALFDPAMSARALERLELEQGLRQAVEQGQLQVHYQPEVDIQTGEIIGAEALVRWAHPERGLLSPGRFIPVAEEMGLIMSIGAWVLAEACRQGKIWLDLWPTSAKPFLLSVNLSVHQLRHPGIIDEIRGILARTGFPAGCLRLEITESAAMLDVARSADILRKLKALGVHLAIDDFGTGYSSLSSLRDLPVDTIKIDKSFVDHLSTDAGATPIIQAIAMLAQALKMEVTVEGIETHDQLIRLRVLECARAQGYYFSKPLPAEAFDALLEDRLQGFIVSKAAATA